MAYGKQTPGGAVRLSPHHDYILAGCRQRHGTSVLTVLRVIDAPTEDYPIYELRALNGDTFSLNGLFLDDASEDMVFFPKSFGRTRKDIAEWLGLDPNDSRLTNEVCQQFMEDWSAVALPPTCADSVERDFIKTFLKCL